MVSPDAMARSASGVNRSCTFSPRIPDFDIPIAQSGSMMRATRRFAPTTGPCPGVSLDERVLRLVFGPRPAAMVASETDAGHGPVDVDLVSKRPIAGRGEESGHELVAARLAALVHVVEMRDLIKYSPC